MGGEHIGHRLDKLRLLSWEEWTEHIVGESFCFLESASTEARVEFICI